MRAKLLAACLALPAVLAGGAVVSMSGLDASAGAAAASTGTDADPAAILARRSPGARPAGALTQTKPRRVASRSRRAPFVPRERVLSGERVRPGAPGAEGLGPLASDPVIVGPPLYLANGLPGVSPTGGLAPAGPIGPGGTILPPLTPGIGGGVLPPDDGAGGGDDPTTPPVASVPEPVSWAMMIVGFFGVGGVLRRRRGAVACVPCQVKVARRL
jgi:hypothetical protein